MTPFRYTLVSYTNLCRCGNVQHHDEFHVWNRRGNAFNDSLAKPNEPLYNMAAFDPDRDIAFEDRRSHTEACMICIEEVRSKLLPPPQTLDYKTPVGGKGQAEPAFVPSIDVDALDFT